jgi:hypothetical protein
MRPARPMGHGRSRAEADRLWFIACSSVCARACACACECASACGYGSLAARAGLGPYSSMQPSPCGNRLFVGHSAARARLVRKTLLAVTRSRHPAPRLDSWTASGKACGAAERRGRVCQHSGRIVWVGPSPSRVRVDDSAVIADGPRHTRQASALGRQPALGRYLSGR